MIADPPQQPIFMVNHVTKLMCLDLIHSVEITKQLQRIQCGKIGQSKSGILEMLDASKDLSIAYGSPTKLFQQRLSFFPKHDKPIDVSQMIKHLETQAKRINLHEVLNKAGEAYETLLSKLRDDDTNNSQWIINRIKHHKTVQSKIKDITMDKVIKRSTNLGEVELDTLIARAISAASEILSVLDVSDDSQRCSVCGLRGHKEHQCIMQEVSKPPPVIKQHHCPVHQRKITHAECGGDGGTSPNPNPEQLGLIQPDVRIPCAYCNQDHMATECSLSAYYKKIIVEYRNLCQSCLSSSHKTSNCKNKSHCQQCNQPHYYLHCSQEDEFEVVGIPKQRQHFGALDETTREAEQRQKKHLENMTNLTKVIQLLQQQDSQPIDRETTTTQSNSMETMEGDNSVNNRSYNEEQTTKEDKEPSTNTPESISTIEEGTYQPPPTIGAAHYESSPEGLASLVVIVLPKLTSSLSDQLDNSLTIQSSNQEADPEQSPKGYPPEVNNNNVKDHRQQIQSNDNSGEQCSAEGSRSNSSRATSFSSCSSSSPESEDIVDDPDRQLGPRPCTILAFYRRKGHYITSKLYAKFTVECRIKQFKVGEVTQLFKDLDQWNEAKSAITQAAEIIKSFNSISKDFFIPSTTIFFHHSNILTEKFDQGCEELFKDVQTTIANAMGPFLYFHELKETPTEILFNKESYVERLRNEWKFNTKARRNINDHPTLSCGLVSSKPTPLDEACGLVVVCGSRKGTIIAETFFMCEDKAKAAQLDTLLQSFIQTEEESEELALQTTITQAYFNIRAHLMASSTKWTTEDILVVITTDPTTPEPFQMPDVTIFMKPQRIIKDVAPKATTWLSKVEASQSQSKNQSQDQAALYWNLLKEEKLEVIKIPQLKEQRRNDGSTDATGQFVRRRC